MRLFTSILWTTVALGLLGACSGNMATPSAGAPSDLIQSRLGSGLPPRALPDLGNVGRVALRTINGHFVTALGGGGGPKEPNCNPGSVALHEDATRIGPWEIFKLVLLGSSAGAPHRYAFQTSNGMNYVSAVDGGGIGGSAAAPSSQLLTNATHIGPNEAFRIIAVGVAASNRVAIQTPDGKHYVSAANGGSCGGPDNVPFHTNAKSIGPSEEFSFIPVD